ncbi:astrotactin-2-like isoform X2 [Dunckerocampus dactyliophorus]|uniref:astrotactin-2-like isoform X2 n=1 Tax=Dunckerocampus dactyliophorus TaxID=161453 RepID=UPI002404F833|nr:astrotactin-2-like isoform X2 [Dunckerocampus dactyliophorus]
MASTGRPLTLMLLRLLLAGLALTRTAEPLRAERGGDDGTPGGGEGHAAGTPCEIKTVTVSTLPVLRENEFSFTGVATSGSAVGTGGGGGGGASGAGGTAGGGPGGGGGESRLLLFVRTDLPGRISVMDDLDNTALPYFTLEMSGTEEDISQVHWKQQWLENGTLYFHVSMTESELVAQATQASAREPAHVLHEHMHLLHISVMGGLIALLLLILLFTLVLYTRHRWCKRRRVPQKSASTEATHEIHYIPSVLLGPQGRDTYRGSRGTHQHGSSVIGMPIRETPILDDYDCDEDDPVGRSLNSTPNQLHNKVSDGKIQDDYGVGIGYGGHADIKEEELKHNLDKRAIDPNREVVEDLMQRFQDSFRIPKTSPDISHYQHVVHSSSTGRRRVPSHNRATGGMFGPQGESGSEPEDDNQMKFYTEQHRGRRRSKGHPHSPLNKVTLTLITISTCVIAIVYATQDSCPLTVKVTLHVPEHFVADGSSFVVAMGGLLDVSNWLNPAKLILYYQTNSSTQWVRDYCGQRTTDPCEQICDQDTGECSCHEGYSPDPAHKHLCVRSDWGQNEGPWPYANLEKGYDLVTGEQAPERIFSLGQGLWLPVSKSFVVPPVELSINPIASCKTDVLVIEDPGEVRDEAMMSTYFETVEDLLASFGPVRDCSKDNGNCKKNFKCVSDRLLDSSGCVCPSGLRPMKDGSGCYDYSRGIDCTDGFNGGCEQLCHQQLVPLEDEPGSSNVLMYCGCVQEYKLAADGRSCLLQSDNCEGPKCPRKAAHFNGTLFGEMLHGYDNKSHQVNLGQIFQMTFRDNNFIKDFPQLADGLMVLPLPVEEQCRGVLSEPLPNLELLTGDAKYNEAAGYPMVQQWRVRSNLYKVKLSSITLASGFAKVLKTLSGQSTREELLAFLQQYGSHYMSEALYGSELNCSIYFPSKKAQQQLWLQYQKEATDQGVGGIGSGRHELKSVPFISYLSALQKTQLLSDDVVNGVEISCEEKGSCPAGCHLCHHQTATVGSASGRSRGNNGRGGEQPSPIPVLLEVSRVVPLYGLVQDNITKEAFKSATMSSYWCAGKGDVIDNWCRCDLSAFSRDGLPNCSPLRQPVLRLAPYLEPSSTMVALEWLDVEPLIGGKVSDYIIQHKRVEDPSEAEVYTGEVLSLLDDLFSGLGSSCVVPGKRSGEHPHTLLYSVVFKCLEPDSLYKFTLYAVDSRGSHSESSYVSVRTSCPMVDDSRAEEIADKVYNLYNGYTSGKEQQMAYNTLMEIPPPLLYRVQHHYNSLYEKFGDFVWRSEDELGPRKANLILRRVDKISHYCRSLLRSTHIQSRTDTMAYVYCRSDEGRPSGGTWRSSLHEGRTSCTEKLISVQRNTYSSTKLR